jgi:hypothetical protein
MNNLYAHLPAVAVDQIVQVADRDGSIIDVRVIAYDADTSCSVHGVKVSDPDYSVWFRRGDIIVKGA